MRTPTINIQNKQAGFTLIELVVVIVILGILAATALPRFVDLSEDAEQAALEGFVGAVQSGDSINFATWLARNDGVEANTTTGVFDTETEYESNGCTVALINTLLDPTSPLPTTPLYSVAGAAAATVDDGTPVTCTITNPNGVTGQNTINVTIHIQS